jgi:hypothetical protein
MVTAVTIPRLLRCCACGNLRAGGGWLDRVRLFEAPSNFSTGKLSPNHNHKRPWNWERLLRCCACGRGGGEGCIGFGFYRQHFLLTHPSPASHPIASPGSDHLHQYLDASAAVVVRGCVSVKELRLARVAEMRVANGAVHVVAALLALYRRSTGWAGPRVLGPPLVFLVLLLCPRPA